MGILSRLFRSKKKVGNIQTILSDVTIIRSNEEAIEDVDAAFKYYMHLHQCPDCSNFIMKGENEVICKLHYEDFGVILDEPIKRRVKCEHCGCIFEVKFDEKAESTLNYLGEWESSADFRDVILEKLAQYQKGRDEACHLSRRDSLDLGGE